MRRVLILSAALSLSSLLGSCGKNQCSHVVELTCSDIRAKAQQIGSNKPPTPEDLCPVIDWKGRERLKEVCSGPEVRESIADFRPQTPLKVAEAMCDGMKLHALTPAVEELTQCHQYELSVEAAREAKKKQEAEAAKNPPKEEPAPPPPVVPAASTSAPSSTPAGTPAGTPPAGTPPAGTPPAGTPPAGTPPAGTPPATPTGAAPTPATPPK